jgi:hypothetical protein
VGGSYSVLSAQLSTVDWLCLTSVLFLSRSCTPGVSLLNLPVFGANLNTVRTNYRLGFHRDKSPSTGFLSPLAWPDRPPSANDKSPNCRPSLASCRCEDDPSFYFKRQSALLTQFPHHMHSYLIASLQTENSTTRCGLLSTRQNR